MDVQKVLRSMHLVDEKNFRSTAIVANSIPVGVGFAYGQMLKGKNSRVFIFLGDASVKWSVCESITLPL